MSDQFSLSEVVTRPAFTVVGLGYHGKNENEEIKKMWDEQFFKRIAEIENIKDSNVFYGVCADYSEKTGEFTYVAGLEVENKDNIPVDMMSIDIPEQAYAVFPCNLGNIKDAYNYIYQTWLPASEFTMLNTPMFEYYGSDFCDGEKLYLYIAVAKK